MGLFDEEEDPQVPGEGDITNEVKVVEGVPKRLIITQNENGSLRCEIEGKWIGKYIRTVPTVVIRAFRKQKYALLKEQKGE